MKSYFFVFDRYEYTDRVLSFYYSYRDKQKTLVKEFREDLKLNFDINPDDPIQETILRQLHLAIGTSYYKSLLGEVRTPYELSSPEAKFWNTVYDNGLGELAYVNKITTRIQPFVETSTTAPQARSLETEGAILGIGGGKDSAVAGELFKKLRLSVNSFHMSTKEHQGQAKEIITLLGFPELVAERHLDTSIVSFTNENEGYHGHIPLSAILAWIGVLAAAATKRRYVCMANESASSDGNVVWNSKVINHQWSKSYEFESLMQTFVRQFITPDIWFFSPLRPYSSLAVVKLFSQLTPTYRPQFTSCNLVLRIDPETRPNNRWCGICAKCLSTWLLLSAYLDLDQLEAIFGKNLFEDISLRTLLRELVGLENHKPLDCVGTTEELRATTQQALTKYRDAPLLADLNPTQIPAPSIEELENSVGPDNFPPQLDGDIKQTVETMLSR